MRDKPSKCKGCALEQLGKGFALTDGKGNLGVLVLAEALGETEAAAGRPLVGQAGQTWDRLVGRTTDPILGRNLSRDDFLHANCINCQPPGNVLVGAPYEFPALDHCRDAYLERTIRDFSPKAIITLGNVPLRALTGQWGIEQLRGYIFHSAFGPVIPTYHPSYIMRGKWNLARVVQLDILKALEVARDGAQKFLREKAYVLSPSWGEVHDFLEGWRAAGKPPMGFDIETPRAGEAGEAEDDLAFEDDASYQILMISLAWEPFKAISIPWVEPFIGMVKEAFKEDASFLVWNAKFDVPRLLAAGVHFGGEVIDVMLAWHWLEPALPMGLKYVATFFCPDMGAWKLQMHKNFQWYNAADSDVLLRVFLEVRSRLEAQGRWRIFKRHFLDFGKILLRMTERGITVDHEARGKAREYFQGRFDQVAAEAAAMAPASLGNISPKRGYLKPPKDTTGLVQVEIELDEKDLARRRKEIERAKKRAEKEREKALLRAKREEAKRAKKLGKKDAKPRRGQLKEAG